MSCTDAAHVPFLLIIEVQLNAPELTDRSASLGNRIRLCDPPEPYAMVLVAAVVC
jgi:hypothetical protein